MNLRGEAAARAAQGVSKRVVVTRAVLMNADGSGIDHDLFAISQRFGQRGEYRSEETGACPPPETSANAHYGSGIIQRSCRT